MSGPMYKFYIVDYTSVAKLVRRKLLTQRSWVRFPVNINIFVKKMSSFFRGPPLKYCRGFERAQPFGRFGHFRVIFEYFKAILEHLIGNIYIQLEGPCGSLLV